VLTEVLEQDWQTFSRAHAQFQINPFVCQWEV